MACVARHGSPAWKSLRWLSMLSMLSMPVTHLMLIAVLAWPRPVSAAPEPLEAPRRAIERGQRLLGQYHCGTCHTIPGVPAARATLAADLGDYGLRSYVIGRWPNQAPTLARWIADPTEMAPGTLMPDMGVSAADARDMAAYLLALRP